MILNRHERILRSPFTKVGELINQLGSPQDRIWPRDRWPAMRFDRPLQIGAVGRHGPIRYFVESYDPGRKIIFHLTEPKGFRGTHRFEAEEISPGIIRFRHVLEMRLEGFARLYWPIVFGPLHDALVEDILDEAEAYIESTEKNNRAWSLWVRLLRWAFSRAKSQLRR